ncbi:MAG: hypothetical protein NC089_13180, partial [Bacteroides sp.]|nr:hypothetical protein [Bacteroides sp.]MCM1550092.1 hypothetical protein [Clostridium sp.]
QNRGSSVYLIPTVNLRYRIIKINWTKKILYITMESRNKSSKIQSGFAAFVSLRKVVFHTSFYGK